MRPTYRALRWLALLPVLLALTAVPAAPQSDNSEKTSRDLVWEKLAAAYRFENDGTGVETQAVRIRVLTDAG